MADDGARALVVPEQLTGGVVFPTAPGGVLRSMAETIALREAIAIINHEESGQKVPFSIDFVTYDANRTNKESKHVHLREAVECGAAHSLMRHDQIGVRPTDGGHQYAVSVGLILKVNGKWVA